MNENKKLIVILGPTASGKSELAVKLAKKFNGEIVSADARQVYKELNIGTAKIKKKETKGIKHYLIDVASPKRRFTVIQYRKLALKAIEQIFNKGKIPFLTGGTGFYIQAVIDGITIPQVKPDWQLRKKLEKKTAKELFLILKKLDLCRAKTIQKENKRRLIRAIEIIKKTKKPIPLFKKNPLPFPVLMIGIKKEREELKGIIKKRFLKWLKEGLIAEVKKIRKLKISWKKIEEFGMHYRAISQYLQKKINYPQMIENSLRELNQYVKRQMTWFKKDKRIFWINKQKQAETLIKKFIKKTKKLTYS